MRVRAFYLLLAGIAGVASAQTKVTAITGARIETGSGRVFASGTVILRDGKIAEIGEGLAVPEGAEVIDGKGKFLFPGFIDGYSTRGIKLPEAPAAEPAPDSATTAPAAMWHGNRKGLRIDVVAAKALDLKDQLAANFAQGITTALVAPGTGVLRGIAAVVNYTDKGSVLAEQAAAEIAIRGGGFGGGSSGYPGSLLGIVALTRQILIDAKAYADGPAPAKPDSGLENLKLLVTGQIPALFVADTQREIGRCLALADEFGLKPSFAVARDAYTEIEALKARRASVIVSVDLGAEPSIKPGEGPDATPKDVLEERHDAWAARTANVRQLLEAGIPVAFSSTGGNLGDYLKNVRRIIGFGITREQALVCMTSGAANVLGIADRTGSIEVGKQANLVLMSAHFADEKAEVISVFVEGQKIDVKKGAEK